MRNCWDRTVIGSVRVLHTSMRSLSRRISILSWYYVPVPSCIIVYGPRTKYASYQLHQTKFVDFHVNVIFAFDKYTIVIRQNQLCTFFLPNAFMEKRQYIFILQHIIWPRWCTFITVAIFMIGAVNLFWVIFMLYPAIIWYCKIVYIQLCGNTQLI